MEVKIDKVFSFVKFKFPHARSVWVFPYSSFWDFAVRFISGYKIESGLILRPINDWKRGKKSWECAEIPMENLHTLAEYMKINSTVGKSVGNFFISEKGEVLTEDSLNHNSQKSPERIRGLITNLFTTPGIHVGFDDKDKR